MTNIEQTSERRIDKVGFKGKLNSRKRFVVRHDRQIRFFIRGRSV
jgi:hypothetical protein